MSVAALQRRWLLRLERLTQRPILAQTHIADAWTPWADLPLDTVLWTRSLLECELLFETDNPDKAFNATCARRLALSAAALGAEPLVAYGGGKSTHVHVFVDPDLELDADTVDAAVAAGVDVWRVVRVTLYDLVVGDAALPRGARLDRAKVQWSSAKRGSMVREFGTPGSTGALKTLGDGALRFPERVPLWRPDADVLVRVEAALKRASRKRVESYDVAPSPGGFESHPCVAKALSVGAPAGERNATGVHLLNLARVEGLSEAEAQVMLGRYFAASGLSSDDKLRGRVDSIWRSASGRIACPNPLGLSVCDGVKRCPKGALTLGS